jgi:hypothetical protein
VPINTTESRFAACLKRLLQQNLPRPEVGHIYSNASATNSFLAKRRCGYALVLMRRGGRRSRESAYILVSIRGASHDPTIMSSASFRQPPGGMSPSGSKAGLN